MAQIEYTTIKHPRTGECYAVEMDVLTGESDSDVIETALTRVAGPIYLSLDTDELAAYISNQDDQDCRDDAVWLRREIERAHGRQS